MYVIGIVISMVSIFFASLLVSNFDMNLMQQFLDWPTTFVIILALIGQIVATSGFKTLVSGLNALFSKKYYLSSDKTQEAVSLFKHLAKTSVGAGIIFMMSGLIGMFHNLADPAALGPMVAVSVMSVFYSVIISFFIFETAAYVLSKRNTAESETVIGMSDSKGIKMSDLSTIRKLVDLCNQNGITPDKIKNATEIVIKNEQRQR